MNKLYDNFEIDEVGEFTTEIGTYVEIVHNDNDRVTADRIFWTVYGHLPTGGVRALIDFDDEKDAREHLEFFNNLLGERK